MPEDSKLVEEARLQRPRSPRVPVDFVVELAGKSPGGEPFQVQAEAIKVSRGGATLVTDAHVNVGDHVRLTPPFGRALDAEVNGVWIDAADGKQRIGVKLLDAHGWFAE
jgi:hypothetical protein